MASEAIARGWHTARRQDDLDLVPMSDGGDGFGEVTNGGVASGLSRKFELANLKLDDAAGMQQHVYALKSSKIVATDVKRVQLKEKKLEGVLVSYQISE